MGGFRALFLWARRSFAGNTVITADNSNRVTSGTNIVGGDDGSGDTRPPEEKRITEAVLRTAVLTKTALEGRVGHLRARLAEERAKALERRAEESKLKEGIRRSERERTWYTKKLLLRRRRAGELSPSSAASTMVVVVDTAAAIGGSDGGVGGRKATAAGRLEGLAKVKGRRGKKQGIERDREELLFMVSSMVGIGGSSELTEKEGKMFGKLQAETLKIRQRESRAEKEEEGMRAEAARTAVEMGAALKEALAEGKRLRAEVEQREVIIFVFL